MSNIQNNSAVEAPEKDLKEIVAQNIYYLRTVNQMTQSELGEKLNYSDKAISKWERADGLPDANVLKKLGKIFGVTVDYILNEHSEQDKRPEPSTNKKSKAILGNVIIIGIVAIALILFISLAIATRGEIYFWQVFIYAIPAVCIVGIVFAAILKNRPLTALYVSLLMWSIVLSLFIGLLDKINEYPTWLLFLIGVPAQIIILLSFKIKLKIPKKTKNTTQDEGK